jgi:hypothetical protein
MGRGKNSARLSPGGIAFLKCAFASPDFNIDPGNGIPDRYQGKVFPVKNAITQPFSFKAGRDTYIMILPIPGFAYWAFDVASGTDPATTTTVAGTIFPGASQYLGTGSNTSDNVDAFRFASMSVGLYPTSNQMQFAGSVSVWKAKVGWTTYVNELKIPLVPPLVVGQTGEKISGLESVLTVGRDNFTTSFIEGCYASSTCDNPDFPFYPIRDNGTIVPMLGTAALAGMPFKLESSTSTVGIGGCDGMDAIFIKVATPTGAVNSAVLKVWSCVEYRPTTMGGLVDSLSKISAPYDPLALQAYREIANSLPVAVRASENANLWLRVKQFLATAFSIAGMVPGPIGQTAQGIDGMVNMFGGWGI